MTREYIVILIRYKSCLAIFFIASNLVGIGARDLPRHA